LSGARGLERSRFFGGIFEKTLVEKNVLLWNLDIFSLAEAGKLDRGITHLMQAMNWL
jgi:hypothetical protein